MSVKGLGILGEIALKRSNSTYTSQNQCNRNTEQTDVKGIGSRLTTKNRKIFAENPSVNAAHVIPSVRSGNRGENSGAWYIPVEIAGLLVNATVDTAANITIVSQKVYDSMIPKPSILDESNIRLAGEGTGMQAQFLGKGNNNFWWIYICVANIYRSLKDEMLLGIDFPRAHDA